MKWCIFEVMVKKFGIGEKKTEVTSINILVAVVAEDSAIKVDRDKYSCSQISLFCRFFIALAYILFS